MGSRVQKQATKTTRIGPKVAAHEWVSGSAVRAHISKLEIGIVQSLGGFTPT